MRVLAYYPLHYGKEYLRESILSIRDHVEKIVILYSSKPTFGFSTHHECPENEQELMAIAMEASDKVVWISKGYGSEGEHRNFINTFSQNFDLILAVDADEVWNEESLKQCLADAMNSEERYTGVAGFLNFWRSFNHVCKDGFCPIRITRVAAGNMNQRFVQGIVYHFSCAQSEKIMDYKYLIHGHKDEIRDGWLENTYKGWVPGQGDLHPVSIALWNAESFDKYTLPDILKNHENFNKEAI
jgi:hypothetical protein